MEIFIYLIILVLMVFIGLKIFSIYKRYQINKGYTNCYAAIANNQADAYEVVNNYIGSLKDVAYINKANVLKLYIELKRNLDYHDTLCAIDLKAIFLNKKEELDKKKVSQCSDVFTLIMMIMCNAYNCAKLDIIIELDEKVQALEQLNDYLECKEIIALYNAFFSNDDSGIAFMNQLLKDDFQGLKYDSNMLDIYKSIAAAILAFKLQPIDEVAELGLKSFARTSAGKEILTDLRLYDKYIQTEQERAEE